MKTFLLRGVPASLQMDGWWLSVPAGQAPPAGPGPRPASARAVPGQGGARLWLLVALIALADTLFWHHAPGLSLAAFALALAGAVLALAGRRPARRELAIGAAILGLACLPVVEHVQTLSLLFYLGGLALFAGWIGLHGQGPVATVLRAGLRFVWHGLGQPWADLHARKRAPGSYDDWRPAVARLARAWAFPVLVGGAFVLLLLAGNPLLEHWALSLPVPEFHPARPIFWAVIGLSVWPFLRVAGMAQRLRLPFGARRTRARALPAGLINAGSIANSLVVFNLIFMLQTGLDLTYLWGGAELPQGMSHAQYAHRGAYPLVATALLAGLFAMIARPYVQGKPVLRALLYLWLVQNLVLTLSSVLRLELYVQSYGLTHLRIAAFIWMGLVATGLALIGWQLARGLGNGWMLARLGAVLVLVLYTCSFVNFTGHIARYNLVHASQMSGARGLDATYICKLGPMALPAIRDHEAAQQVQLCPPGWAPRPPQIDGWREWGFRSWRVQRYLAATAQPNRSALP